MAQCSDGEPPTSESWCDPDPSTNFSCMPCIFLIIMKKIFYTTTNFFFYFLLYHINLSISFVPFTIYFIPHYFLTLFLLLLITSLAHMLASKFINAFHNLFIFFAIPRLKTNLNLFNIISVSLV